MWRRLCRPDIWLARKNVMRKYFSAKTGDQSPYGAYRNDFAISGSNSTCMIGYGCLGLLFFKYQRVHFPCSISRHRSRYQELRTLLPITENIYEKFYFPEIIETFYGSFFLIVSFIAHSRTIGIFKMGFLILVQHTSLFIPPYCPLVIIQRSRSSKRILSTFYIFAVSFLEGDVGYKITIRFKLKHIFIEYNSHTAIIKRTYPKTELILLRKQLKFLQIQIYILNREIEDICTRAAS